MKKGDKVEIISNIPFSLKDKTKPITGTITHIDGFTYMLNQNINGMSVNFMHVN